MPIFFEIGSCSFHSFVYYQHVFNSHPGTLAWKAYQRKRDHQNKRISDNVADRKAVRHQKRIDTLGLKSRSRSPESAEMAFTDEEISEEKCYGPAKLPSQYR
jgi:hypothetical protein